MSNHNRKCKDGFYSDLFIKGKQVLDTDRNMRVRDATIKEGTVKKDLTVCGDLKVKGCITQLGEEYDVIICGAGTAGSIAAKDISDAGYSVLVLEQGENENENVFSKFPFGNDAAADYGIGLNLTQPSFNPRTSDFVPRADQFGQWDISNGNLAQQGGRGWGGASNHNYLDCYHTTNQFDDLFASSYGDGRWNSTNTLPVKQSLETYVTSDTIDASRGTSGPLIVSKPPDAAVDGSAYMSNVIACMVDPSVNGVDTAVSAPLESDINKAGLTTARFRQSNRFLNGGTRTHSGNTFLGADVVDQVTGEGVGGRKLKVVSGATVNKIHFQDVDGTPTATSVEAVVNGKCFYYKAKHRIIISAGGLRSPGILERSGVGDATRLTELGIPVVKDLPGVGENYSNHPIAITFINIEPTIAENFVGTYANFSYPGSPPYTDIYSTMRWVSGPLAAFGPFVPPSGMLEQYGADLTSNATVGLLSYNHAPTSRGSCHIVDKNPSNIPELITNYFTSAEDINWVKEKIAYDKRLEQCLQSNIPALNATLVVPPSSMTFDDANITPWARALTTNTAHPMGTCSMGQVETGNVVDPSLNVYGVNNLKVADNSIWTIPPPVGTTFPAMQIGRMVANFVIAELAP